MVYPQAGSVAVGDGVTGVGVCVGVVGSGVFVTVGGGVIVGVGVSVGVFVAVGVFVGSGVFVGVGNVTGEAPLEILQAGSLNWIEKPKFAGPKLSGAFMNEPAKTPPQSTVRVLLGFAALVKPIDVVEVGSSPKLT